MQDFETVSSLNGDIYDAALELVAGYSNSPVGYAPPADGREAADGRARLPSSQPDAGRRPIKRGLLTA
ncbi:MAG TPA: hypothetical protein VG758_28885 [Hyphomicrobiaceae bacterium]|jgi:hypothetical protein|nr:hypothetical protein [Hyphomicrobiaceae bacterium]